ncbi:MAG: hypothetical protein HY078_10155 [Elusimicrobia bacterium]|nr:hypothetical protein [Elusimicrobiota bacterium]
MNKSLHSTLAVVLVGMLSPNLAAKAVAVFSLSTYQDEFERQAMEQSQFGARFSDAVLSDAACPPGSATANCSPGAPGAVAASLQRAARFEDAGELDPLRQNAGPRIVGVENNVAVSQGKGQKTAQMDLTVIGNGASKKSILETPSMLPFEYTPAPVPVLLETTPKARQAPVPVPEEL